MYRATYSTHIELHIVKAERWNIKSISFSSCYVRISGMCAHKLTSLKKPKTLRTYHRFKRGSSGKNLQASCLHMLLPTQTDLQELYINNYINLLVLNLKQHIFQLSNSCQPFSYKIFNYVYKLHTKFHMSGFKNSVVTCYQMENKIKTLQCWHVTIHYIKICCYNLSNEWGWQHSVCKFLHWCKSMCLWETYYFFY
jgi:hypothetical protein